MRGSIKQGFQELVLFDISYPEIICGGTDFGDNKSSASETTADENASAASKKIFPQQNASEKSPRAAKKKTFSQKSANKKGSAKEKRLPKKAAEEKLNGFFCEFAKSLEYFCREVLAHTAADELEKAKQSGARLAFRPHKYSCSYQITENSGGKLTALFCFSHSSRNLKITMRTDNGNIIKRCYIKK